MRTIKFRAWDKNNNFFLDWYQLSKMEDVKFNLGMFETADWLVFQQFTGLLDKNGKEIYEGDVLKSAGIVSWNDEEVRWSCIDIEWNNKREWYDMLYLTTPLEIIGNIYENPELITK